MEVDYSSLLLTCGSHVATSFQRRQYGRGGESKYAVEKLHKHPLSQEIKINPSSKSRGQCMPLLWCDGNVTSPLWASSAKPHAPLSPWENFRQISLSVHVRDILWNARAPKNWPYHQKPRLGNCHRGAEATWGLRMTRYPAWNPGTEKGH